MEEFLEKLFHTKLGIGLLIGIAVLGFILFNGCSSGESCTCGCIRYTCIKNTGCDNCGCSGGCDDIECTACGCGYERETLNCDGRRCSDDSLDVFVTLPIKNDTEQFESYMHRIENGDNFISFYYGEGYKYFKESAYFEIEGFYCNEVRVLDGDGNVINEGKLKKAVNNYRVDLTMKVTEKKLGEKILVKFTSEHTELVMNPVMVTNGETVDFFPTPELEGKTFLGWREAGTDKIPAMIKSGMEFHLYIADAGLENTITLEPVFGLTISLD